MGQDGVLLNSYNNLNKILNITYTTKRHGTLNTRQDKTNPTLLSIWKITQGRERSHQQKDDRVK